MTANSINSMIRITGSVTTRLKLAMLHTRAGVSGKKPRRPISRYHHSGSTATSTTSGGSSSQARLEVSTGLKMSTRAAQATMPALAAKNSFRPRGRAGAGLPRSSRTEPTSAGRHRKPTSRVTKPKLSIDCELTVASGMLTSVTPPVTSISPLPMNASSAPPPLITNISQLRQAGPALPWASTTLLHLDGDRQNAVGFGQLAGRIRVARGQTLHHVHAAGDLTEDGVASVKGCSRAVGDEELRAVGIRARIGHTDQPGAVIF